RDAISRLTQSHRPTRDARRRGGDGEPAMTDATTTLADLKEGMARFVAERDWQQFHAPKNLAMALAAEAAELMEHFLWIDNDASRELVRDPKKLEPIADEMADVLGVVLALANALDRDLSQA